LNPYASPSTITATAEDFPPPDTTITRTQAAADGARRAPFAPGRLLGRYRIIRTLGEGGMGVVYRAVDERLNREVALKTIRGGAADEHARTRLWREARSAASLRHPNVCQLFEISEEDGELFLTMELLDGEPLSSRIARGPLACAEAVQVALAILSALEALHRHGLVHRDLKPSNVFLTPHGVKLLDFGLARSMATDVEATATPLTLRGSLVGTPNYMAPEQVVGGSVDGRADLFAAGCVLFEMLCGKPPFASDTTVRVLNAIVTDDPPALGGSPLVVAIDRVVRRVLEKQPAERYQTADAMAHDLRQTLLVPDSPANGPARPMTRLIVLPLRVLRPDAETDFLAFGLSDAITNSLSGLDSLVVRSSVAAARFADTADVTAIGTEAGVDVVLTGTLVRAGGQLRVSAQLVAASDAAVLWSHTSQVTLGDLFVLQDQLASRIVESLSLPLTDREHRLLKHDVPATAKAYEFYLRGSQALAGYAPSTARDLFLQCLDADPRYAPAWARLGAAYRSLGKFDEGQSEDLLQRADEAFRRALELNPDLSLAHNLYARLKADLGRAHDAMVDLLDRARIRTSDVDLFAGLVQSCRYCGLLDASAAAAERARRLDRLVRTSAVHTYFMMGDYQRALDVTADEPADPVTLGLVLLMLGRTEDALHALERGREWELPVGRAWTEALHLVAQGRRQDALAATQHQVLAWTYKDPETIHHLARQLAFLGDGERALVLLERALHEGFYCAQALSRDPWLDSLRADARFTRLLHEADARSRASRAACLDADGDRLLGLSWR
jgi:TolB-like protein/tRNA A-37 threonylcarbamoyl transferase component Bud32